MKRVIITGATGTIGVALVRYLVAHDIEVLVLMRRASDRKKNVLSDSHVNIIECDMSEYSELKNESGVQYDVFFHLAWAGASGQGRNDMFLQNANVRYSLDAVALAKRFGCRRFVGIGSQAEYGRCNGKLSPFTPTFPEMGYGYAKLCAGHMTRDYAHQIGLEHVWVRVLSVYGDHDGKNTLIMATIDALLEGKRPKTTKGEQLWDYLYNEDAAEALYLLAERGSDGKTYVLGSGKTRSIREYITDLRNAVDTNTEVGIGEIPYSNNQVMYLCADICDIERDTGWKPRYEFMEGIRNTVEYERNEICEKKPNMG